MDYRKYFLTDLLAIEKENWEIRLWESFFKVIKTNNCGIYKELLHLVSEEMNWTQFSSVAQSHLTLCDPMDCGTPGFPVYHQLLKLAQTHLYQVGDAIQLSHSLSSPSLPAFSLSQHQGFFQWVSSSHQVAKVLEFLLQHQSFQWIFRTDLL